MFGPLRRVWGANFLLVVLLVVALGLRLYGIDWDQGHGFHPDERSFYMRAGDMLCLLTASADQDGPYCSASHLRSLLATEQFLGIEPGLPDFRTALSAERSPLNPRWFPLGSVLIYALVLLRTLVEPFADWGIMELRFIGRTLAALADVGSVFLLYVIGRRMYGQWVGILAAAFATFAVIHIQHAHFYRPEPFTVLASLAALWAMLRFIDSRTYRDAALLGALVGLAMAPKVSVAPMVAPLVLTFLWVAKDRTRRDWTELGPWDVARIIPTAALAGAAGVLTFFFTTPYAFLDFANFVGDIREQTGMAGEAGRFPFTWQYADTPAFLYQLRQTTVWGLGIPLGIVTWASVPITALLAWRGGMAQRCDVLLLAWFVPAFVFLELFEVKFLRYVFPLVPFAILMAARALVSLVGWARDLRYRPYNQSLVSPDDAPFSEEWHATPPTVGGDVVFDEPLFGDDPFSDAPFSEEWHATPPLAGASVAASPTVPSFSATTNRTRVGRTGIGGLIDRYAFPSSIAFLVVVLALTVWYAIAFTGIYGRTHTAITASDWIKDNVRAGTSIVNGGSNWDEQIPDLGRYDVWTFPAYHPDRDPTKIRNLVDRLADSEYLLFYSNRAYGSVSRLPHEFPQSSALYRLLFSGQLGYQLERAFTSYPSFAGVHLRDDPFGRAGVPAPPLSQSGDAGLPGGIVVNLGYADENVIGYDHPQVLVFKNIDRLDENQIRNRISTSANSSTSAHDLLMLSPAARDAQQSGGTWSHLFNRDGWANRVPWLAWLLAVELIFLIAFPFMWWLFRPLPDRGICFARALGLLLVALVTWWLVNSGLLTFSLLAIIAALVMVSVPSALVLLLQWRNLLGWLRKKWRFVITAEALFLLAFLAFVLIRAANPDLWHPWRGGEKPMELAYFTAVARSSVLPPFDPWFSGGYLNYYYWGYFILSVPLRLTGIPPTTAFNVAVPLIFALTATGIGSLVYNMVAVSGKRPDEAPIRSRWQSGQPSSRSEPQRRSRRRFWGAFPSNVRIPRSGAVCAGIVAALMAVVCANLDGVLQLAEMAQRKASGIAAPLSSFDFWRSSRAIPESPEFAPSVLTPWLTSDSHFESGFHITEFPFFTFLFADLHAHMTTMPFAILSLALGFSLLVGFAKSGPRNAWPWITVAVLAVSVGSLWAINSWEYPAYALLMLGFVGAASWMAPGTIKRRLTIGAIVGIFAVVVSYMAFLPFHQSTETFGTGIEPTRWRTPLSSYLLIHALSLLAAIALLSATLPRALGPCLNRVTRRRRLPTAHQWLLAGVGLSVLAACYFLAAGFATAGLLTIFFTLTLWSAGAILVSPNYSERRADVMALAMLAVALAIGIGVDFVRIEGDIARMNTLFKYYLVAWILFAAAGAYGLWRGWTIAGNASGRVRNTLRWGVLGLVIAVFAGTLVYPVLATPVRIQDRFNALPPTLDGAAWMPAATYQPPDWCVGESVDPITLDWDYDAINWLQDNVRGSPVVLEAHGTQYCWNARISQYTGLPTVLGWPWHQQQQRNDGGIVNDRARDISTIYNTPNPRRALGLLDEYDVKYIVVGGLEHAYYDERGIAKFDAMVTDGTLALEYTNARTRIYRVIRS